MTEFTLKGKNFIQQLSALRFVKSKTLHFIKHKNYLYVVAQEAHALGWIKLMPHKGKFNGFSVDAGPFISICKQLDEMVISVSNSLQAKSTKGKFTVNNFPIKPASDFTKSFIKTKFKRSKATDDFMRSVAPALKLSMSVNASVELIQFIILENELLILGLAKSNSLGYVGQIPLTKVKGLAELKLENKLFSIPVEAIRTYLNSETNSIVLKNTKTIVFDENYFTIFIQKDGGLKESAHITSLLNTKPKIEIDLDLNKLFDTISKLPGIKTIELFNKEGYIGIQGKGQYSINTRFKCKTPDAEGSINLNFAQCKQLISIAKDYNAKITWAKHLIVICNSEPYTHNFLLASVYSEN